MSSGLCAPGWAGTRLKLSTVSLVRSIPCGDSAASSAASLYCCAANKFWNCCLTSPSAPGRLALLAIASASSTFFNWSARYPTIADSFTDALIT